MNFSRRNFLGYTTGFGIGLIAIATKAAATPVPVDNRRGPRVARAEWGFRYETRNVINEGKDEGIRDRWIAAVRRNFKIPLSLGNIDIIGLDTGRNYCVGGELVMPYFGTMEYKLKDEYQSRHCKIGIDAESYYFLSCDYLSRDNGPVKWNPYNKVVQDHRDGTIFHGLTNRERAKRGLTVPWTEELAYAEVRQPPIN